MQVFGHFAKGNFKFSTLVQNSSAKQACHLQRAATISLVSVLDVKELDKIQKRKIKSRYMNEIEVMKKYQKFYLVK